MKYRTLATGLVIATMGLAGIAQANPGNGHNNPGQASYQDRGHDMRDDHRDWHKGGHVPDRYRDDSHWVQNWHDHDLPEPPRGHRWLEIDGDYVLAAVATGVITSIIFMHDTAQVTY